jgi:hypothetical protein
MVVCWICLSLLAAACTSPRDMAVGMNGGVDAAAPPVDAQAADGAAASTTADVGAAPGKVDAPPVGTSKVAVLFADLQTMDFGRVEVAVKSDPPRTWTLTNVGQSPSGMLMLVNSSPAQIVTATTCTGPLASGQSCTISVSVSPALGPLQGSLEVTATPGGTARLAVTAEGAVRLTVVKNGVGTVTSTPAGIDCGATCTALVPPGSITLQARTANGSDAFFSGWSGACGGALHDCPVAVTAATTVTATFSPMTANLVFISSKVLPTNLGSPTAYDVECNKMATAAGINDTAGGAYIAFISGTASLAMTRLGSARGWVRPDGKPFADSLAGLFSRGQIFNSIRLDENSTDPGDQEVNTGANYDGTLTGLMADNCGNWSRTTGMVIIGYAAEGSYGWTGSQSFECKPRAIVCMGKSKTATVTPVVSTGKRIWITNTPWAVGAGSPDAKCLADRPAGVTTGVALLSTTRKAGATVLDANATYVRVDGTRVGTGAQLIAGQDLESGIWQAGNGTYPRVYQAWTGSYQPTSPGTTASTCADWTDPMLKTAELGVVGTTIFNWWSGYSTDCGYPSALYCVESP